MMLDKNTKFDKEKQYMSISSDNNTEIVELPDGFKDFAELMNSEEYKNFVNRKHEEEIKKRKEETKLSLFDGFFKGGNGVIMTGSGLGKSFFSRVPEFIREWNIKKRKEKINKLLNK